MNIAIEPYPDFAPAIFTTTFPEAIAALDSPAWLLDFLSVNAEAPVARSEDIRKAVRDLLRHKGYKPTGRGKPAAEYLVKAAENDTLGSINLPVDACNVVSLHSGLPISVVDLDLATAPFSIKPGNAEAAYVFNQSGQEISVAGLLCLHDTQGPCANAVKDSQRTKTNAHTTKTLTIIWAPASLADQTHAALDWYTALLQRLGAKVDIVSTHT